LKSLNINPGFQNVSFTCNLRHYTKGRCDRPSCRFEHTGGGGGGGGGYGGGGGRDDYRGGGGGGGV
jgi:hypothetical protein